MNELWQEERFGLFIIFGYETVKRISLKEEYKGQVRW